MNSGPFLMGWTVEPSWNHGLNPMKIRIKKGPLNYIMQSAYVELLSQINQKFLKHLKFHNKIVNHSQDFKRPPIWWWPWWPCSITPRHGHSNQVQGMQRWFQDDTKLWKLGGQPWEIPVFLVGVFLGTQGVEYWLQSCSDFLLNRCVEHRIPSDVLFGTWKC